MGAYNSKDYKIEYRDIVCAWLVAAIFMIAIFSLM
jgi:hypothetical protein